MKKRAAGASTGWSVFSGDLGASIEAIGLAPMLVVISILLNLVFTLTENVPFIAFPVLVFQMGFVGTQRVWFARVYRGESMARREVVPLTRSFVARFARLGLLMLIALTPTTLLTRLPGDRTDPVWAVLLVVIVLVLDVCLTFVVPALALTTSSVREALNIGLRMLKDTWPSSAWYLLTPGLSLGLFSGVLALASYEPGVPLEIAISAAATILVVWFKGAIVAFYLRQTPAVR